MYEAIFLHALFYTFAVKFLQQIAVVVGWFLHQTINELKCIICRKPTAADYIGLHSV